MTLSWSSWLFSEALLRSEFRRTSIVWKLRALLVDICLTSAEQFKTYSASSYYLKKIPKVASRFSFAPFGQASLYTEFCWPPRQEIPRHEGGRISPCEIEQEQEPFFKITQASNRIHDALKFVVNASWDFYIPRSGGPRNNQDKMNDSGQTRPQPTSKVNIKGSANLSNFDQYVSWKPNLCGFIFSSIWWYCFCWPIDV